jgi:hypothetical protein
MSQKNVNSAQTKSCQPEYSSSDRQAVVSDLENEATCRVIVLEKGEGYYEGDSCTKGTVGRHTSSTINTTLIAKDRAHTKLVRPDCLGPILYGVCDRRGKDCKCGE